MADLYSTLGVKRDASEVDIKSAYRKLAKQLHPDKTKDNPKAAERFKEVSAAYAILGEADKRAAYDRGEIDSDGNPRAPFGFSPGGPGGAQPGPGGFSGGFAFEGDPSDLFSELFGGRARSARGGFNGPDFGGGARAARRGADRQYRLRVSFEDAARLETQRVSLASGKTLDVKLPAGFESGTQVRLARQGEAGPGGAGDAIGLLEIDSHPYFTRDGQDVRLTLPIRLDEAVLGAKVRCPTVDGPVMVSVPPGSSSGRVLRLRGKGFHVRSGGRGDQLVELQIEIPASDPALTAFAEGWTSGRAINPRAHFGVE